ncbi:MAG: NUDIX domain-containing protein [Armatimonadota bacterium]|nr:NUDIX domain-containing protein [bacterium]
MDKTKPLALSLKIVIKDHMGRWLVLKRSLSSKNNPGCWDLPGGKMDPGEDFEQAILREVSEETGLVAWVEGPAGTAHSESPSHRIIYLILKGRVEPGEVRLSDEHDEYAWVHPRDLIQMDLVEQFRQLAIDCAQKSEQGNAQLIG